MPVTQPPPQLLSAGRDPAAAAMAPERSDASCAGVRDCRQRTKSAPNAAGVGHDDRVAIVLPNGSETTTVFETGDDADQRIGGVAAVGAHTMSMLQHARLGRPTAIDTVVTAVQAGGAVGVATPSIDAVLASAHPWPLLIQPTAADA